MGWAPDGKHFFINNEMGSNVTELYVFDRVGKSRGDLQGEILGADPNLQELVRRGSHTYFNAEKWIDAGTLQVEVAGHTDETPVREFDMRFRVPLEGMVTRL